jgi:beta propeller repeat protein
VTGTTTVLSTRQSDHPTISSANVFFEDFDGTQWDPFFYDISTGTSASLLTANTTNEFRPVARGGRAAFVSDDSGTFLVSVLDFASGVVTRQTPARMSVNGQGGPVIDYLGIAWLDGREITSTPMGLPTDDIDIYGASFGGITGVTAFPGENALATALSTQSVSDVDGLVFAWSDHSAGNWNTVIGDFGGELVLTTHPATQADPTVSGNVVLWEDNRLGNFDIYGSVFTVTTTPTPGSILINEILADPMAGADPNGDGTASTTQDEFVEIVNASGSALDLSGMTLSDATGVRHTFAAGTVLPALGTMVVFSGGRVGATSLFGGARIAMASSGALGLNNDADTITLRAGTTVIDTVTYGTIAGMDESIVRSPEVGAGGTFVRHSTMTGALGRFSPGNTVRGFGF